MLQMQDREIFHIKEGRDLTGAEGCRLLGLICSFQISQHFVSSLQFWNLKGFCLIFIFYTFVHVPQSHSQPTDS